MERFHGKNRRVIIAKTERFFDRRDDRYRFQAKLGPIRPDNAHALRANPIDRIRAFDERYRFARGQQASTDVCPDRSRSDTKKSYALSRLSGAQFR